MELRNAILLQLPVGGLGNPLFGDILPDVTLARSLAESVSGRSKRSIIGDESARFWSTTTIYYTFSTSSPVTSTLQTMVREAFAYLTQYTCLNYVEFTGSPPAVDYILVHDLSGSTGYAILYFQTPE